MAKDKTVYELGVLETKAEVVKQSADVIRLLAQGVWVAATAVSLAARLYARALHKRALAEEAKWFEELGPDSDLGL